LAAHGKEELLSAFSSTVTYDTRKAISFCISIRDNNAIEKPETKQPGRN
jgi:hypothetical protein